MMSCCLLLLFPLPSSAETQKKTFTRVDVEEQQRFNQEEKVALVVGVGDYPKHSGLSRLNYADDDARVISDQLKQLGYRVKVLVNAEATKGAVLNLLEQFGQILDKDQGTLLFYFSGHGFSQDAKNYLATYETTPRTVSTSGLALDTVLQEMKSVGAKRQMLFIDACRNDPSKPGVKSVSGGKGFVNFDVAEGSKILFSTKFGGVSYETNRLGGGRGVFSHFVLEGLKGKAQTHEGFITFDSLSDYVTDSVLDYGFEHDQIQKPFVGGESLGDFLVAHQVRTQRVESTQSNLRMNSESYLTVEAKPRDARIRILNSSTQYHPGVALKPGRYHLEVSAPGYETERWWKQLLAREQATVRVSLKKQNLPEAGRVFQDVLSDGHLGPEMVVIPAGRFMMGSETGSSSERPTHEVRIPKGFALGKYEITVGEFREFADASGYRAERGCMVYDGGWKYDRALSWKNPGFKQNDDHPVTCIAVADAQAYVKWLSKETTQNYRLPSESEWEYAARAGTSTKYSFGDDEDLLCDFENGRDRTIKRRNPDWPVDVYGCRDGFAYTAPVGQFHPNRFGLYDTQGNVSERVQDCWHDNYEGAPRDGSAWISGNCIPSTLRGGSWMSNPDSMRTTDRGGNESAVYSFGFRVARDM